MSEELESALLESMLSWTDRDIDRFKKSLRKGVMVTCDSYNGGCTLFLVKRWCGDHQIELVEHAFYSIKSHPHLNGHVIDDIEGLVEKVDMMLL